MFPPCNTLSDPALSGRETGILYRTLSCTRAPETAPIWCKPLRCRLAWRRDAPKGASMVETATGTAKEPCGGRLTQSGRLMPQLVCVWISAALLLLAMVAVGPRAQAQQRVLNVYNWTDYIDPAALKRFETEFHARVNYDEFDSLETLEAKLLAGHSGYDIVVPSDEPSFSRLIEDGALAPIDHASIPNWHNLDPALMQ